MVRDSIEDAIADRRAAGFAPVDALAIFPAWALKPRVIHEERGETLRQYGDRLERERALHPAYDPTACEEANRWAMQAHDAGASASGAELHARWRARRDARVADLPLRSLCLSAFAFDPAR